MAEQRRPNSFIRKLSIQFSRIVISIASLGAIIQAAKSDEVLPLIQSIQPKPLSLILQRRNRQEKLKDEEVEDLNPLIANLKKIFSS